MAYEDTEPETSSRGERDFDKLNPHTSNPPPIHASVTDSAPAQKPAAQPTPASTLPDDDDMLCGYCHRPRGTHGGDGSLDHAFLWPDAPASETPREQCANPQPHARHWWADNGFFCLGTPASETPDKQDSFQRGEVTVSASFTVSCPRCYGTKYEKEEWHYQPPPNSGGFLVVKPCGYCGGLGTVEAVSLVSPHHQHDWIQQRAPDADNNFQGTLRCKDENCKMVIMGGGA